MLDENIKGLALGSVETKNQHRPSTNLFDEGKISRDEIREYFEMIKKELEHLAQKKTIESGPLFKFTATDEDQKRKKERMISAVQSLFNDFAISSDDLDYPALKTFADNISIPEKSSNDDIKIHCARPNDFSAAVKLFALSPGMNGKLIQVNINPNLPEAKQNECRVTALRGLLKSANTLAKGIKFVCGTHQEIIDKNSAEHVFNNMVRNNTTAQEEQHETTHGEDQRDEYLSVSGIANNCMFNCIITHLSQLYIENRKNVPEEVIDKLCNDLNNYLNAFEHKDYPTENVNITSDDVEDLLQKGNPYKLAAIFGESMRYAMSNEETIDNKDSFDTMEPIDAMNIGKLCEKYQISEALVIQHDMETTQGHLHYNKDHHVSHDADNIIPRTINIIKSSTMPNLSDNALVIKIKGLASEGVAHYHLKGKPQFMNNLGDSGIIDVSKKDPDDQSSLITAMPDELAPQHSETYSEALGLMNDKFYDTQTIAGYYQLVTALKIKDHLITQRAVTPRNTQH